MELFTELLLKGHRRPTGECRVVPVFLEDAGNDLALLQHLSRHAGVPIIVAADGDQAACDGVPLPTPAQLTAAQAIRSYIESAARARGLPLDFVDGTDAVTAQIPGEGIPDNPGSRNAYGAIAALLHPQLISQPLAVLVIEHDQMDADHRDRIWRLMTDDIAGASVPLPTTIVLAIGGERFDPLYMGRGPGLQFVLGPDTLVRRREWESDERDLRRLARADEPLVLFLGAGSSRGARLPLGDELRNVALGQFFADQDYDAEERPSRFFAWVHDNRRALDIEHQMSEEDFVRRLTLERVLREMRAPPGRLPEVLEEFADLERSRRTTLSPGLRSLQQFIGRRKRLVIVTVNFDRLIEDSLSPTILRPVVDDVDFSEIADLLPDYLDGSKPMPVPLLKLHGDIDTPDSIIADVELTAVGLSPAKSASLHALVGTASSPRLWAYVGYSMRDPDVVPELIGAAMAHHLDEYWIDPLGDPNVRLFIQDHRESTWRIGSRLSYDQRHITETAEAAFEELAAALA